MKRFACESHEIIEEDPEDGNMVEYVEVCHILEDILHLTCIADHPEILSSELLRRIQVIAKAALEEKR